ncbi:MAG: ester cyclase [Ignavibacteriaceae bacterium]|nr:ester cyclase [Ignavibacteriaceae bacterium]
MKRLVYLLKNISLLLFILQVSTSCQEQDLATTMNPLIDKYVEVWNNGNLDELDAITSEKFELRMTPDFEPKIGRNLLKDEIRNTRKGFPDFKVNEDKRLFVGDSAVVIHWMITGTNTGRSTMPPTGNKVNVPGFSVIFFADNLITGEWIAFSDLAWVSQLGFTITPPEFNEK